MQQLMMVVLVFIGTICFAQNTTNAGEYMNYFSSEYQIIQKDMWDYTKSVSHGRSAKKVEKRRMELIRTCENALKKAEGAKDFNGSSEYKDAVVEYFTIINLVLKEDYAKIVDMEAVAEQSYDAMEAYMMARDLASDKQMEASEALSLKQKEFAEANNIQLISSEDKMDQKMKIAGEVFDHYNEVYLIFFKSNKQELYLLDAIGRGDMSGIEQNREALKATVEEGFIKLKDVKLYEGDAAMVDATKDLFKFYESEASKSVDLAIDYFLKMENFEKIKEAFDQKKERDRTQEDIDQYNNSVNDLNSAVEAYNAANEDNNRMRGKLIDAWNNTAGKFTNKYVPRGN